MYRVLSDVARLPRACGELARERSRRSAPTQTEPHLFQLSERYWPFTAGGIVTVLASFISFVGLMVTKSKPSSFSHRRARLPTSRSFLSKPLDHLPRPYVPQLVHRLHRYYRSLGRLPLERLHLQRRQTAREEPRPEVSRAALVALRQVLKTLYSYTGFRSSSRSCWPSPYSPSCPPPLSASLSSSRWPFRSRIRQVDLHLLLSSIFADLRA